jgi:hypothetical protein
VIPSIIPLLSLSISCQVDAAMGLVVAASKEGKLTDTQEDALLDMTWAHDAHTLLLAKHYQGAAATFARHALRYLSTQGKH